MTADIFARNEYRDYIVYKTLAEKERVPEFKKILEDLTKQEWTDYQFWLKISRQKSFSVSPFTVWKFILMRKVLGLTFIAKFLETAERKTIDAYNELLKTMEPELAAQIKKIIEHEEEHEDKFISQIKEEKVQFIGSIVLGLNDGLIELTGALVGFSFALNNPKIVAMSGLITGIAASFSMAASSFMQARYEVGKNPKKAAFYTGLTYILVVLILTAPFLIFSSIFTALILLAVSIFLIIGAASYYTSVLFNRKLLRQISEMAVLSIGVAILTFIIGLIFRLVFGLGAEV
ncbi:rubrerythrin family protein [Patescibacteria group bacterium]|nr:MAG: rubrerythrin family protein [Patescibacteria group bacterium]